MRRFLLLICLLPLTLSAQLRVIFPIQSGMVLQREKEIRVRGVGESMKEIRLQFDSLFLATTVDDAGTWSIVIPPRKANRKPQDLLVYSGNEQVVIRDLLIGDLWICIGQSNMEWPMQREMHYSDWKNYTNSSLRFYNPVYAGKNIYNAPFTDSVLSRLNPERFYEGHWQTCDPESLAGMSAVAFYFGKMLSDSLKIPIGLVNLSIGGAPLETFISTDWLFSNKRFTAKINKNWLMNDALPVWIRERGRQNVGNLKNPPGDFYGPYHPFKPGFAFSAGIRPFSRIPIAGVICYQGESNAQEMERVMEYNEMTALMLRGFRNSWNQPGLPYYYVQLSSIDTVKYKGHLWPEFRNEQRLFLQMDKYSGMAVSSDVGERHDVHPRNKMIVGERLAHLALHKNSPVVQGPLPLKARYRKGVLTISFAHSPNGLLTADGSSVRGFSFLDGKDLPSVIAGNQIKIQLPEKPIYIYYGWKSFSEGNLMNREGFPASTFKLKVQ